MNCDRNSERLSHIIDSCEVTELVEFFVDAVSRVKNSNLLVKELNAYPFLCPYCQCIFVVPFTLRCGHTFCAECLSMLKETCLCGSIFKESKVNLKIQSCLNIILEPHQKEVTISKSSIFHSFKDSDVSIKLELIAKYLAVFPKSPGGLCIKGSFLSYNKQFDAAIECFDNALKMDPSLMKAYYLRALCLIELNMHKKAFCDFAICAFLNKSNQLVQDSLKEFILYLNSANDRENIVCEVLNHFNDVVSQLEFEIIPENEIQYLLHTKISLDDLECSICYNLFTRPITASCGHTFCCTCLQRCLDHGQFCPICKAHEIILPHQLRLNNCLDNIIKLCFPEKYNEVRETSSTDAEECNFTEMPIFVCTISFPEIICPLHIFEPRYRLMLRRCIDDGTREFGMCVPLNEEGDYSEYGCTLKILNTNFLSDGTSFVKTVGARRFKVMERKVIDGYNSALVEFIEDSTDEVDVNSPMDDNVRQLASRWMSAESFNDTSGSSSENGPVWHWRLLDTIPIDSVAKSRILAITSQHLRLLVFKRILEYFQQLSTENSTS